MKTVFGLDFGTTNSTLAVNRGGEVSILDLDPTAASKTTLRSIVYFDPGRQVFVGQEAIDQYLDHDAQGRFMQSLKTFLSSASFTTTTINGRAYHLDDLVAILLRVIKQRGETIVGERIDTVVMGRPAVFSDDTNEDHLAEERLRSAAKKAGFEHVAFQFEPIAAALTYERTLKPGEEKKVFVGDFGGGTSDFTVIRLCGGASPERDRKSDILSLRGITIGGDTFDSRIMTHRLVPYYGSTAKYRGMRGQEMDVPAHIFTTLSRWHLIPQLRDRKQREHIRQILATCDDRIAFGRLQDLIDNNYGFKLFQAIERTKCALSFQEQAQLDFSESASEFHQTITRGEFERMISTDVHRIERAVDATLASSEVRPEEIDAAFITGGSSYIPSIRRLFVERFGEQKLANADAFTSVGFGLGLAASYLFRDS
jgi:hypothetical chaperone protein